MDICLDPSGLRAANVFMSDIESGWQQTTGLVDRADYSIFFSPCVPSPVMVLGANPGGSSSNFTYVDVTLGQHEYIEGHGPTSQNFGKLLLSSLDANSMEGIRGVVGTNVIWRRSPHMAELKMTPREAARETSQHLRKVIQYVAPQIVIFGGKSALDLFIASHGADIVESGDALMGPNGSNSALYFGHYRIKLSYSSNVIDAFVVLHPCKGLRDVSVERLRSHVQRILN
jgi:hypothetical protein